MWKERAKQRVTGSQAEMSCTAEMCHDAVKTLKSWTWCQEPKGEGCRNWTYTMPWRTSRTGGLLGLAWTDVSMISTANCSRQPKRAHKIRTVLIPTDGAEKSGHFPFTPETRSPTVMENLFCPPLYGLWSHRGSRSTGLRHRKGQHGRSSSGCKSALPLPERTMPAQFTPAEDLIGIWLWLQN